MKTSSISTGTSTFNYVISYLELGMSSAVARFTDLYASLIECFLFFPL